MQIDGTIATMNPLYAEESLGSRLIEKDLEVWGEGYFAGKIKLTSIGGIAILLTNKTGAASVEGELVISSTVTANAVALAAANEADHFGFFLESGVADGSEAWIVISGIAEVKADATGYSKGDRLIASSATGGRVETGNTPSTAEHWTEIGHALEDAAANAIGKAALHFN